MYWRPIARSAEWSIRELWDWDERIATENLPLFKWGTTEYAIFVRGIQAGADAMLETLCKGEILVIHKGICGKWVFIPEEK